MRKLLFIISMLLVNAISFSQKVLKVAMLEPIAKGDNVTVMQKEIIRGTLEEAITNIPGYEAFTRTDIDQITKELSFQQSGMVNDNQRMRVGDMSGAELICLSQITIEGSDFYVKASLVEVESGRISRTANELMKSFPGSEIFAGCQKLAQKLMGNVSVRDKSKIKLCIKNIISEPIRKTGGQKELSNNSYLSVSNIIVREGNRQVVSFNPNIMGMGIKNTMVAKNYGYVIDFDVDITKNITIEFTVTYYIERYKNGISKETRRYTKFIEFQFNKSTLKWEAVNIDRLQNPYDVPFSSFVIKDNFQFHDIKFTLNYSLEATD